MSDGPSDDGRTVRSDAASRLAALLADVVEDPAPSAAPTRDVPADPVTSRRVVRRRPSGDAAGPVPTAPAERTADPDATQPVPLVVPPPTPPEADVIATARAEAGPAPAPARPSSPPPAWVAPRPAGPSAGTRDTSVPRPALDKTPDGPARPPGWGPPPAPLVDEDDDEFDDRRRTLGRAPRLTLRAVGFGLVFALLVAAIPALGWVGKDRLLDSRGGDVVESSTSDETAPGYTALVDPTLTAMVVHRDSAGVPVSATVLALGAGDEGGTVILVPLTLGLAEPGYFDRVIDRWVGTEDDDTFRRDIEDVIGVSVPPPLIDVRDADLATLVAPVAPLDLTVNDPVIDEDGVRYEGNVSLSAEQVGPYLRATREGEPEIGHLERSRDVWMAWLDAIGAATSTEPIGTAATGIGSFLRILAAGDPVVETLDVEQGEPTRPYVPAPYVPGPGMADQIVDAVPFPRSPRAGRRFDLRLLNGAEGATPPATLMRDLALDGAAISTLGNAASFGSSGTVISYKDDMWEDEAEALRDRWGDSVEIEQMSSRVADATAEDMVITLGSDVLDQYEE